MSRHGSSRVVAIVVALVVAILLVSIVLFPASPIIGD